MTVELYGYEHSVYSWIARLVLREKNVAFDWNEIDPFATSPSQEYLKINPFNRVPTLINGSIVLYETQAITRYIDEFFPGMVLQPSQPRLRAIQNQLISIADSYAYWPMVRQVFSHAFFRPKIGGPVEDKQIEIGLEAASNVLAAINEIATDSCYLVHEELSLADLHLYPMIAYFVAAPQGADILKQFTLLQSWYDRMQQLPSSLETIPNVLKATV